MTMQKGTQMTPDPSLPHIFTHHNGSPVTISTLEVCLTLTSRDCPCPSWRLCIKHDIIVLGRSRDRGIVCLYPATVQLPSIQSFPPLPSLYPVS